MKKAWVLMVVLVGCTWLMMAGVNAEEKASCAAGAAETKNAPETTTATGSVNTSAPQLTVSEADMQWLWGEIVSIDESKKTATVKYVDYETDQEKQAVITCDDATAFENITAFNEIKAGDTVSIDYITREGGVNLARIVSLEKLDDTDVLDEAESSIPAVSEDKP